MENKFMEDADLNTNAFTLFLILILLILSENVLTVIKNMMKSKPAKANKSKVNWEIPGRKKAANRHRPIRSKPDEFRTLPSPDRKPEQEEQSEE